MKFKFRGDTEARKRKQIAAQALQEIQALVDARYPLAMLFDKAVAVERQPGEGYPAAFARYFGLDLIQLRDFAKGTLDSGLYVSKSEANPTARDLLNYFKGWAALWIITRQEIANQPSRL